MNVQCTILDCELNKQINGYLKENTMFWIDDKGQLKETKQLLWHAWDDLLPIMQFFIEVNGLKRWGYFQVEDGAIIKDPMFDYAYPFYGERACVVINGQHGFIDEKGNIVCEMIWDDVLGTFYEGICAVKQGEYWGYINKQGEIIVEPQFEKVHGFSFIGNYFDKKYAALVVLNGKFGFIDGQGQYIVEPQFESAKDFTRIGAPVKYCGKWALIDCHGGYRTPFQFDEIGVFSSLLAKDNVVDSLSSQIIEFYLIKIGNEWGILDAQLNIHLPAEEKGYIELNGREVYLKNEKISDIQ